MPKAIELAMKKRMKKLEKVKGKNRFIQWINGFDKNDFDPENKLVRYWNRLTNKN